MTTKKKIVAKKAPRKTKNKLIPVVWDWDTYRAMPPGLRAYVAVLALKAQGFDVSEMGPRELREEEIAAVSPSTVAAARQRYWSARGEENVKADNT